MLYKKYHRNFIKQFRKGVKFSYETYKDTVRIKPFYDGSKGIIRMIGKKYSWILIYCNGRVDYEVKIGENVV